MVPDELVERWYLTDWSLSCRSLPIHIALVIYPVPECFDIARRFDAVGAGLKDFGQSTIKPTKKKAKQSKKAEGQMKLW